MEDKTNITINWEELDEFWAKCYEEDYGHLFNSNSGNKRNDAK